MTLKLYLGHAAVNGSHIGGPEGHSPPDIFSAPFLAPHLSREVNYFEFEIYCLLQIHGNREDVQEISMIPLGCHYTFPQKKQLRVNFQMLMETMRLYFLLCYRPVLIFLCHLQSILGYKATTLVLKLRVSLGHMRRSQTTFLGVSPPRGHAYNAFFGLNRPW